jgi:hypothetical protein
LIVLKRAPLFRRYGTSILQGGVASRPGQVNTHIVSRALEVSEAKHPRPSFQLSFLGKKHHLPRQARDNKMVGSENSKTAWRFLFSDRDFQLRLLRQRHYGKKNGLFEPFIIKNHYFAKTGSGQIWGKLQKRGVFRRS